MQKNQDVCGCGGHGSPRGLGHLIDALERQREQEKRLNQAEIDTGDWPIVKPVPDARPKPEGRGGCA